MADRKASVALELKAGQFKAEAEVVERKIEGLDDKVEDLDKDITKIPPDAAKAAAALKLLGGDAEAAGKKVYSLGEKNTILAVLDSKIRDTRTEVKKLADEFTKTGDVDVFRKLGDSEGLLRRLQDTRRQVKDALEPDELLPQGFFQRIAGKLAQLGESLGKMLPDALSGALSTPVLGPIIAGALLAGLVSAVDLVLAAVGGGILAAAGGGVIGLGIMGALLGSPDVVGAAWARTGEKIKASFADAAQPFRQPLIDAAHEAELAFAGIHLDQTLAKAAGYMPQLVRGASETAGYLGKAAGYLVDGAGPEVRVIAEELPRIGNAIAVASREIAGGSEGGAQALRDLAGVVEIVIAGLGGMIGFAERTYGDLVKLRDFVIPRDWLFLPDLPQRLETGARALGTVSTAANTSTATLEQMMQQVNATAVSVDSLAAAMVNKLFTATMNIDQASLQVNESLLNVGDTLKKNKNALNEHTEAGIADHRAVLAAVTANMQLYQAQVAAGMSAEDAAAAYDQNTAALEAQLRKAHLTQGEIDGLIGKYRGIPHKVDTDIAMHGLTEAINGLNETIRLINGLHSKTIYVTVKQVGDNPRGQSRGSEFAYGGIRHAAAGMIVGPSNPGTLIGEPQTGGEALIPLRGISQSRAMGLASVVGSSYGFSVGGRGGNISITLIGGDPTMRALLKEVRAVVRTDFGGSVELALGQKSR